MALFRPHGRGHIIAEINVTPLTDVFLVLLIIFMITTSAMVKPAADVDLPKAAENETEPKGIIVTMTPSHEIYVNERLVGGDDATLASVLRDALDRAPDKVVVLAGRRRARPASPWPPSDGPAPRRADCARGAARRGNSVPARGRGGQRRRSRSARASRAAEQGLLRAPRAWRSGAGRRRLARSRHRPRRLQRSPPDSTRPHAGRRDGARRRSGRALPESALARPRGTVAGGDLPPRVGAVPGCPAGRRPRPQAGAVEAGHRGILAIPAGERGARDLRREPLRTRARLSRSRGHGEGD